MEQKIYVIDTNIFLEFLLSQKRAPESIQLMQEIEQGTLEAYVTSFSLHSIEVILDRLGKRSVLEEFIDRVINAKGLQVYQTDLSEEKHIAQLTEETGLDFDDTLQYHVTRILRATLISFDRDFDKTDMHRVEPSAVKIKSR